MKRDHGMQGEGKISEVMGNPLQDPVERARAQMKQPLPKKFFSKAAVAPADPQTGQFAVHLDGRPLRTPARKLLAVSHGNLAEVIAQEWDRQVDRIDPASMPVTRLVNIALDAVADRPGPVRDEIVSYAGTDMLCYRAAEPEGLVSRQRRIWDPVMDWAAKRFSARFVLSEGIMHVEQPHEAMAAINAALAPFDDDPLRMAALNLATTLTGSAILALALGYRAMAADDIWTAAHLDEDWNIERWGEDDEAMARRTLRYRDFMASDTVLGLLAREM